MSKLNATIQLLKDNGGCVTLTELYQNIGTYYTINKSAKDWKAGVRGVINRELDGRGRDLFTRKGKGTVALR